MNSFPTDVWPLIALAASVIAGIAGFAVQAYTLKKTRLEHTKLQLEIQKLRREMIEKDAEDAANNLDVKALRAALHHARTQLAMHAAIEAVPTRQETKPHQLQVPYDPSTVPSVLRSRKSARKLDLEGMKSSGIDEFDAPAFLRKQAD